MTSGTWSRHTRATEEYDVVGLGFNYRIDEPRSALLLSRLARMEADIARRREVTRAYRRKLASIPGLVVPFEDAMVADSSCYVMPVLVPDDGRRGEVRARLLAEHGVQTSVFYPSVHEFAVYRERYGEQRLPETERASRTEITLPLFPHLRDEEQDHVVAALEAVLA
jgi:dTDP-4-amino-4,6-dideoxygalactose transaminase